MKQAKKQVSMRLPVALIHAADLLAESRGWSRHYTITRMLRAGALAFAEENNEWATFIERTSGGDTSRTVATRQLAKALSDQAVCASAPTRNGVEE